MNKLTLLVDSNWLLQSRFSVLSKNFDMDNSEIVKEQASIELEELLAKSINIILHKFPVIDNIILVADGGSWRKSLDIPSQLEGQTYKGNRVQDKKMDWTYIYRSLNNLIDRARSLGITVSQFNQVEGDDWIWYWSRRLNNEGTNCLIWSSDNDLKQLIQIEPSNGTFTAWYNDRNGLWLHDSIQTPEDPMDFFMRFEYYSPVLESIKSKTQNISYIDPNTIITSKIICGDAGDNIMPVIRYKKGQRNYRITEKDWGNISNINDTTTIQKLLGHEMEIASSILNTPKFKKLIKESVLKCEKDDIEEMIRYNIKLVWLNENVIPDTIVQLMNQQEYIEYDISYLRSNYKILLKDNDNIQYIFDSI